MSGLIMGVDKAVVVANPDLQITALQNGHCCDGSARCTQRLQRRLQLETRGYLLLYELV